MDTQPKIPTLKDSKKPQVKIRGLEAGVTLFDRLKQFKKKDLAFILAGLGTLFMAPLAEHFMMSPEAGDSSLHPGWGQGGTKGIFDGSGSSPYEPGTSGMAPGSAIGGGSDIITPLNVRDPSALVMGPGATNQPPTNSAMPSTPPPTAPASHSDSDLKDALAASARGVGAAVKKALLPVPKIALSGSGGLRGLGVVNGGSTASAGGGGISSNGLVSGKASNGGNMGGVRSAPGYRGVARGQAEGNGTNTIDALKKAADAAAGAFNRGPASTALNTAANTAIPTGGDALGGGGAGGHGSTDKANSGDTSKDSKSVGESLAFLKAKAMQEAQIALWAKEQEAGDSRLELLKMRNSMAESIAGSIGTSIGTYATCPLQQGQSIKSCWSSKADKPYTCEDALSQTPHDVPANEVGVDAGAVCGTHGTGANGSTTANATVYYPCGNASLCQCPQTVAYTKCSQDGAAPKSTGDNDEQDKSVGSTLSGLGNVCSKLDATENKPTGLSTDEVNFLTTYSAKMKEEATLHNMLNGNPSDPGCGASGDGSSVASNLRKAVAVLTKVSGSPAGATAIDDQMMNALIKPAKSSGNTPDANSPTPWSVQYQAAKDAYAAAKNEMTPLQTQYNDLKGYLGDPGNAGNDASKYPHLQDPKTQKDLTALKTGFGTGVPKGIDSTFTTLQSQIAELQKDFDATDKVALDNAGSKGTLSQVIGQIASIGLNGDMSADKVKAYNDLVGKYNAANPAPAPQLAPLILTPPSQQQSPPAPSTAPDPMTDVTSVVTMITGANTAAANLKVPNVNDVPSLGTAMDTFIKENASAPNAADALTKAGTTPGLDVTNVATAVLSAEQTQATTLQSLSSRFQNVGAKVNSVAGGMSAAPVTQ